MDCSIDRKEDQSTNEFKMKFFRAHSSTLKYGLSLV